MRNAKRVREEGSKRGVNTQDQKGRSSKAAPVTIPAETPEHFARCFLLGIQHLSKMVTEQEAKEQASGLDPRRVCVIKGALAELTGQGAAIMARTPFEIVRPDCRVKPFGPVEQNHETEMARYHICDVWKAAQTDKASNVCGGVLPALADCIRHHPGLGAETAALDAISSGDNELIGLMNATTSEGWEGHKLNGAELWFGRKLKLSHDGPFSAYLALLDDARIIFADDPNTARVAAAIGKILQGRDVVCRLRRFLDSL